MIGPRARRGFFVFDAVVSMFLIIALATTLTTALLLHLRATKELAVQRRAQRLAERALVEPAVLADDLPEGASVRFVDLETLPSGRHWVEATATLDGRSATLLGLLPEVPADLEPTEGATP